MRTIITALGAGVLAAGCAAFEHDIDDGGRAAEQVFNAPVEGPASDDEFLAQPWRLAEGALPERDRSGSGRVAPVCDPNEYARMEGMTEEELSRQRLPENHRIICHGCAVTQDYFPDRVNFFIGPTGVVERITCG